MAEGEDPLIDFGDNDNGDDDDEQETNRTRPFLPGAASTPYHGGEQHEMQPMLRPEQSGLPDTSYEETPLLGDDLTQDIERRLIRLRFNPETGLLNTKGLQENHLGQEDRDKQISLVKRLIKIRYPHANVDAIVLGYSSGKNPMDIVYRGPKGGETKVVLEDGSDLQKSFLKISAVKKQLGPPAADIIQKTSSDIRKKQKELQALRNSERLLRSKNDEVQNMQGRIKEEQARLDQLKEDQETDNKEEIRRKEQLLKNLKKDLKDRRKETKGFQKKSKPKKSQKVRSPNFNQVFLKKKVKEMPWKKDSTAQKLLML